MPTYLTARALALHGSEEQKRRWLPPIANGQIVTCWAVTEPDTGSDVAAITTRATRDGDNWRISGRKMFITNASISDCCLLLCRTGGEGAKGQLTTFVLPMDLPGIEVTKNLDKMGLRSSPTCEVSFDDVVVPDADRLGEVGGGWEIGMDVLDYERIAIPAMGGGMCARALDLSLAYAESRRAFGGPIADIGAVSGMLAEMSAGLLQCRLLFRHVCALVDAGRPSIAEGSIGKLAGAKIVNEVVALGVQIHGGYGYCREYEIERLYRDARLWTIGGGTSEIQRKIVTGQLRRQPAWPAEAGAPV
jgi:alkylation response protein AidB-like acyl-CoA dehydrogenase